MCADEREREREKERSDPVSPVFNKAPSVLLSRRGGRVVRDFVKTLWAPFLHWGEWGREEATGGRERERKVLLFGKKAIKMT